MLFVQFIVTDSLLRVHRLATGCPTTIAKSSDYLKGSIYSGIDRGKGSGSCIKLKTELTMATARVCALLLVLSATLAQDIKLKYKPSTTPVRLFTEEELKRYDGSEVNFICKLMHNRDCF